MSIGCFTDKKHRPTETEIKSALGKREKEWIRLVQFLRERFVDYEEWKFTYGKRYGWALHLRSGRKMVTNLFPTQGGFTVQVNLSEEAVQEAFQTNLNPNVRQAMNSAPIFPEGRWMWIPVKTVRDLKDIQNLLIRRMKMLGKDNRKQIEE